MTAFAYLLAACAAAVVVAALLIFRGHAWGWVMRNVTAARVRVVRDCAMLVAAGCGIIVMLTVLDLQRDSAVRGKENQQILQNTDGLREVRRQTSPEAIRRQQDFVNWIISAVDCNNQAALQRTIDVLVERGVLEGGDVQAITDACRAQRGES